MVFLILLAASAFTAFSAYRENLSIESPSQLASTLVAVEVISADFNETGTLVFYPNNVGPVPYLFYQDQSGHTMAKALVFPDSSPDDFSSWSGAHISVIGKIVAEHVVVSSIAYIAGP